MESMDSLVSTLKDLINLRRQQQDKEVIAYIDRAIDAVVQRMSYSEYRFPAPTTPWYDQKGPFLNKGPGDDLNTPVWTSLPKEEWHFVQPNTCNDEFSGRGSDFDDKVSD